MHPLPQPLPPAVLTSEIPTSFHALTADSLSGACRRRLGGILCGLGLALAAAAAAGVPTALIAGAAAALLSSGTLLRMRVLPHWMTSGANPTDPFRVMADAAPVLLWVAGPDGKMTFVNRPWTDFTGRPARRELSDGWIDALHPEDRDRCRSVYAVARLDRKPFRAEFRLRRADGESRWVLMDGRPVFGGDRAFQGFIGSAIDVTERVEVERAVRGQKQILSLINEAHVHFTRGVGQGELFTRLLAGLLDHTSSSYGVICGMRHDQPASPVLTVVAQAGGRALPEDSAVIVIESHPDTLWAEVVRAGRPVMIDPEAAGLFEVPLPAGSPAIETFLALPFGPAGRPVGVIGLANRPGGYPPEWAARLESVLGTCVVLMEGYREHGERTAAEADLRFQKAVLESQNEASPDGVLVVGLDNRWLSHNRRFVEMWDIPADVVASRDDARSLAAAVDKLEDPETFLTRVAEVYADPDAAPQDEVRLRNGRVFDRHTAPVRGGDGTRYGRIWTFRDVTGQKRAEDARRESQERFQAFMDHMPAYAWVVAEDGRIEFANPALARMMNLSPAECLGKTAYDLVPPRMAAAHRANDRVVTETGRPKEMVETFRRLDGTTGESLVVKFPIRDNAGRRLIGGVALEITERKRAEERLRLAVAHGRVVTWDYDALADTTRIDPAYYEWAGIDPATAPRTSADWLSWHHPDDRERLARVLTQSLEGTEPFYEFEYRSPHPDGRLRWFLVRGSVVRDVDGRVIGSTGTTIDITERKRTEDAAAGQRGAGAGHPGVRPRLRGDGRQGRPDHRVQPGRRTGLRLQPGPGARPAARGADRAPPAARRSAIPAGSSARAPPRRWGSGRRCRSAAPTAPSSRSSCPSCRRRSKGRPCSSPSSATSPTGCGRRNRGRSPRRRRGRRRRRPRPPAGPRASSSPT